MGYYEDQDYPHIHESVKRVREKIVDIHKPSNIECSDCWARNICHRCPPKSLILHPDKKLSFECEGRRVELKRNLAQALEVTLLASEIKENGD